MAKTNFIDGNPAEEIPGTVILAAFMNVINNHHHRGLDQDGDGDFGIFGRGVANKPGVIIAVRILRGAGFPCYRVTLDRRLMRSSARGINYAF